MTRIAIPKTYKLFINGEFPRSERNRVLIQADAQGNFMANYAWATRKDLRNAISAARSAYGGWAKRSAFNRSQILYRLAEILEDRRAVFAQKLVQTTGVSVKSAEQEVQISIDRVFYFAGWADKYGSVLSSVNPVAQSFFNFTNPEATGVAVAFPSQQSSLLGLIDTLLPVLTSGCTAVLVVENPAPVLAIDLAEAIAVSDVPAGVVNILTGQRKELLAVAAGHRDVNALTVYSNDGEEQKTVQTLGAENVKRVQCLPDPTVSDWLNSTPSLYQVVPYLEFKTAWHPIGT
ncbi:MAG TPA: aldehyde dehydrogenase family protein [Anaerolineales bacterium]|nr:aldehyde dehydrogenase family protein [Anaerolineales bacterium]